MLHFGAIIDLTVVVNYLSREMATEAEEEVIDRLGSRDPRVGLETKHALIGHLQTTLRGMADLVLEMAKGLSRDQGTGKKSSGLNGVAEMKKLVLIVGGLNIPRLRVTILLGLVGLLLREVDRLKEVLLRVDRWSLPCSIISMALL